MSKSAMLRTRRRDVNVKPNRRLDRKSSRGMIYENEELRLRTININAEIERGQSDIKKLRRENEQLRKEIWCLRDEYEKLDKLLKDKENSSGSSYSSETDSCTSCSESEDNESSQNLENVQKTVINNLRSDFDHLSVVTEETSAENSDKNSPKEAMWDAIPPDQSYPMNGSRTLPSDHPPKHFFSPLKTSKSFESCTRNDGFGVSNWSPSQGDSYPEKLKKTTPDILIKTDSSTNSFTNGGNLEELLHDIESISNDILHISSQSGDVNVTNSANGRIPRLTIDDSLETLPIDSTIERPYKSELSVVLMPKAMPLLGFDKYQNIKSSLESIDTIKKSSESLQILDSIPCFTPTPDYIIPPPIPLIFPNEEESFPQLQHKIEPPIALQFVPPTNLPHEPLTLKTHHELSRQTSNPFFYGTFDGYQNSETFTNRYNPDLFAAHDNLGFKNDNTAIDSNKNQDCSKEDKLESTENEKNDTKKELNKKEDTSSPKSRRTRKVSIYFKGKKDKLARSLSLDTSKILQSKHLDTPKPQISPTPDKKSLLDDKDFKKSNLTVPKTATSDSKLSLVLPDAKDTPSDAKISSSDSKNSNYDRKHRKSSSTSPERKHVHVKLEDVKKGSKKRHKKSERRMPNRRNSMSADKFHERSFSVCTDRSNILDAKFGHFDDYTNSERDRSNSLSSCDTIKSRKMSSVPQFQVNGKIPWFGCWGNGCL